MALKKTVISPAGFLAIDAYHRIESVEILDKVTMRFSLRSYKTLEFPFFEEQFFSCAYMLESNNPIKQAYEHLKTLANFSDAENC